LNHQIFVLVRDQSGDQRTMTYKSYLDLQDRFTLIGQSDEEGNQIPGDPNLSPRHQKVAVNDVAVHAVDTGMNSMSMEEKQRRKEELMQKFAPSSVEPDATNLQPVSPDYALSENALQALEERSQSMVQEPKAKKKPGPKPKEKAA
jgi:hypothetical protein